MRNVCSLAGGSSEGRWGERRTGSASVGRAVGFLGSKHTGYMTSCTLCNHFQTFTCKIRIIKTATSYSFCKDILRKYKECFVPPKKYAITNNIYSFILKFSLLFCGNKSIEEIWPMFISEDFLSILTSAETWKEDIEEGAWGLWWAGLFIHLQIKHVWVSLLFRCCHSDMRKIKSPSFWSLESSEMKLKIQIRKI